MALVMRYAVRNDFHGECELCGKRRPRPWGVHLGNGFLASCTECAAKHAGPGEIDGMERAAGEVPATDGGLELDRPGV